MGITISCKFPGHRMMDLDVSSVQIECRDWFYG